MLFSPISDPPVISQWYGSNKKYYEKYGMKGHNGIDFAIPVGTPVYAPHEGYIANKDNKDKGYGRHVLITSMPYKTDGTHRRTTLAHLSSFACANGAYVAQGDLIGYSGNTGDSTGPHLHWTYCVLDNMENILNYNNGFHGAVDLAPLVKGKRRPLFVYWPASSFPQ